ncbi:hypothetical protein CapIbe_004181 [Capra ibex]
MGVAPQGLPVPVKLLLEVRPSAVWVTTHHRDGRDDNHPGKVNGCKAPDSPRQAGRSLGEHRLAGDQGRPLPGISALMICRCMNLAPSGSGDDKLAKWMSLRRTVSLQLLRGPGLPVPSADGDHSLGPLCPQGLEAWKPKFRLPRTPVWRGPDSETAVFLLCPRMAADVFT